MVLRLTVTQSYDLFVHNCNNFSNDFAMFLVGKGIPDHITSLPQTVLNTPFGQMLRPQLDRAMRDITQAPVPPPTPLQPHTPQAATNGLPPPSTSKPPTNGVAKPQPKVQNVTRLSELTAFLTSARPSCAIIFFTSSTCPPCKLAYPTYESLAQEFGSRCTLIKTDLNVSYEIVQHYQVRATPTFMTFLHGEKLEEWSGADPGKLAAKARLLVQMAWPPHPHFGLRLKVLGRPHGQYVVYAKIPPLEKLVAKLGAGVKSHECVIALRQFVERHEGKPEQDNPLPDLMAIGAFVVVQLSELEPAALFPLIDLMRLALVDARVSGFFAEEASHTTVLAILHHVLSLDTACPHSLRIVTLQLACNLFSSKLFPRQLASDRRLSAPLVNHVTSALLDAEHAPVRVCAASLAFNLVAVNHAHRLERQGENEQEDDLLEEGLQLELVASLVEALGREGEDSKEGIRGMVLALGLLVFGAKEHGEVWDLVRVLDAKDVLNRREMLLKSGDGDGGLVDEAVKVVS